jgi:hypothetical protein
MVAEPKLVTAASSSSFFSLALERGVLDDPGTEGVAGSKFRVASQGNLEMSTFGNLEGVAVEDETLGRMWCIARFGYCTE